jgi:hypothetical protein
MRIIGQAMAATPGFSRVLDLIFRDARTRAGAGAATSLVCPVPFRQAEFESFSCDPLTLWSCDGSWTA